MHRGVHHLTVGALTLLLVLPTIGAPLTYLMGQREGGSRAGAVLFSLLTLGVNGFLLLRFDYATPGALQFVDRLAWIPQIGATYIVGVDVMAVSLILLTTLLTFLAAIFTWDQDHRPRAFYSLLLLMEATVIGVFVAQDYLLFFFFWEASLLPMFWLINVWGGPDRDYAAIKFFLYTQAASLLVLLGIMAMVFQAETATGTFSFAFEHVRSAAGAFPVALQAGLFVAFLVGFGAKMPIWPVHTWLPDAHVQAPTAGSVILAGVLLKMGGYGLIRIALPNLAQGAQLLQMPMFVVATVTILYGAMLCLAQEDLKGMIAYSSISHMGVVLLGIATLDAIGLAGAIWMMFAHGLISGGMFMVAGVVQHEFGTRLIPDLGGIADVVPRTSAVTLTLFMASLGLPGMVGFVAEIMTFLGTWNSFGYLLLLPVVGVVLTASYFLWAMQRALFGPLSDTIDTSHLADMHWYEAAPLAVLVVLVVAFGMWPAPLADPVIESSHQILQATGVIL